MQATYDENEFLIEGATLKKYVGKGGEVRVPDGVESIGEGAFKGNATITGVIFPSTLFSVGQEAFKWCKNLRSVTFGEHDADIYDEAFFGCESLCEINLPFERGGERGRIGERAFAYTGIRKLFIPEHARDIGRYAFEGCDKIESIEVDGKNYCYKSDGNCILGKISIGLFSYVEDPNNVVLGCKNSVIPPYATSIDDGAFRGCTGLEKLNIPRSVTRIGGVMKEGDVSYKNVDDPFAGCVNLREIVVEKGNENFAWDGGCLVDVKENAVIAGFKDSVIPSYVDRIEREAFAGQTGIESVVVPAGVNVCVRAFKGCTRLKKAVLSEGVRWIEGESFADCIALEEVTVPKSLTSVGWGAFAGCGNLRNITVEEGSKFAWQGNCLADLLEGTVVAGFKDCVIPNGVTAIETYAFKNCVGLKEISIPPEVTTIGKYGGAFEGCAGLVKFAFPDGVTGVAAYTFRGCVSLEEAYIPDSVTEICSDAFEDCERLRAINIPNGVKKAGNGAFRNCKSLTNVVLPASVSSVGRDAFEGCDGLEVIKLPEALRALEGTYYALILPEKTKKIYY